MGAKSKTSVEILFERDALQERVTALEGALLAVRDEVEQAAHHPHVQLLALRRIGAVVRKAVPVHPSHEKRPEEQASDRAVS
jgi:hypothetical protein